MQVAASLKWPPKLASLLKCSPMQRKDVRVNVLNLASAVSSPLENIPPKSVPHATTRCARKCLGSCFGGIFPFRKYSAEASVHGLYDLSSAALTPQEKNTLPKPVPGEVGALSGFGGILPLRKYSAEASLHGETPAVRDALRQGSVFVGIHPLRKYSAEASTLPSGFGDILSFTKLFTGASLHSENPVSNAFRQSNAFRSGNGTLARIHCCAYA